MAVCLTLALSAVPAAAAPLSDCTPHRGTIVAVDFAHWGGPIVRGCGIGEPTGYALLHAAGFTTAGDSHDGSAFVCRLGDSSFHHGTQYPTPGEDPCIQTPSESAYWAYWVAPAGQNAWAYSSLGAMGDVPHPGEVELWIFGATNTADTSGSGVPRFSPSTLRAAAATTAPTRTTTTSTSTSTTTPRTTTTTTSTTTASRHTVRPARKPHHKRGPAHPRVRSRTSHHAPRHRRAGAGTPRVVPARPTRASSGSGSALPLVIGICLALALAAAGAWTAWRRRRYD